MQEAGVCRTVQDAFDLLGKKWTSLIIHVLMDGEKHFCDLTRAVPDLSDRMLSLRMHELESAGIVNREVCSGSPLRVVYRLTEKGLALRPVLAGLTDWAYAWNPAPTGTEEPLRT